MRVVLTRDLRVRDLRPAHGLLAPGELADLCVNGGIAPRSLDELRETAVSRGEDA